MAQNPTRQVHALLGAFMLRMTDYLILNEQNSYVNSHLSLENIYEAGTKL